MTLPAVINTSHVPVKLWTAPESVEPIALTQLSYTASLPFIFHHVAAMPDVHPGKGATVGTVIATQGALIPAAVGVDIGCGMCAVQLPFKVDRLGGESGLKRLRHSIERSIPLGHERNHKATPRVERAFEQIGTLPRKIDQEAREIALLQLGSLGGGNHFIEVCQDLNSEAWIVLHSGSRNIGKRLADTHIRRAQRLMNNRKITLPDPDLAYFLESDPEFKDYVYDVSWAQNYAKANRQEMMIRILKVISHHVYDEDRNIEFLTVNRIDCHHNYVEKEVHFGREVWVTRKGAVRAETGDLGIIPGSMGTKTFLVRGLGNPDSFCSCSHGAGRKLSRTEAKQRFSLRDLSDQTRGVECRKDMRVLDEIPGAYKDITQVMANQMDLVEIVGELKQLITVKG